MIVQITLLSSEKFVLQYYRQTLINKFHAEVMRFLNCTEENESEVVLNIALPIADEISRHPSIDRHWFPTYVSAAVLVCLPPFATFFNFRPKKVDHKLFWPLGRVAN